MSSDERGVSGSGEEVTGMAKERQRPEVLRGCLVDGDAEQTRRETQMRRRALVVSTLLQAAAVLAVIAVPFFGKGERIALAYVTPLPPYHAFGSAVHEEQIRPAQQSGGRPTICFLCPAGHPKNPSTATNAGNTIGPDGPTDGPIGDPAGNPCLSGCINIANSEGPKPPEIPANRPRMVHVTRLDPAMLIERVEPVYPALARQTRREGQVELRATISTDGRIESLEMVSGDVLFQQSAMDAVRRWRYRATILNGQPVRVDTYITVIYTMQH